MSTIRLKTLLILFILSSHLWAKEFVISGFVRDKTSGEVLIGANVFIEGTSLGSATDQDGFYKITSIQEGSYNIKATYIGYKTSSDVINLEGDQNVKLDFNLNYTTIEGEEIIVTEQAKGQMDAINKQLNSKSIVNIISSDRIQELPDANAAETVARVPGVSIQREGGEGNKVVIRGLSPKYNSITVNGNRLASTDSEDRSTDLSMVSQYMLDGIEVRKAGTPDLDADVLGGTVNFLLKKAEPNFHFNVIGQGMYSGLKNSYDDNKLVFDISNRFWKNRIGILLQQDLEKRNRSSNELGTSYDLIGEQLDSVNTLQLSSLNLLDVIRLNDRKNMLAVLDINIPNGNISYSNLNSLIDKDITTYGISYALPTNYRYMSSGTNDNSIEVLTESWAYKQSFYEKLHVDAFKSYSRSKNSQKEYIFSFDEPFAYDTSTYDQSLQNVQLIAKNDTSNMALTRYDHWINDNQESEQAYGLNIEYDFRVSDNISGKIKIGNKFRKKIRTYDRHHEFGNVAAAAGLAEPRDSLISLLDIDSITLDHRRIPLLAFLDDEYDDSDYFNGRYEFGAVADIDYMMEVYRYFEKNWNKFTTNSSIDEYVMHHVHQTDSQIYDYSGEENYRASFFMADLDIGTQINVVTGGRIETNETIYHSNKGFDHALPHWIYTGETVSHKRKNSFYLPAFFLNYKPKPWLSIRYAKTHTLTRPDYINIIPLMRVSTGSIRNVDWRNKFLKPGKSENTDISLSAHQDKLGLVTMSYFEKNIQSLIYSSGSRVIFEEDTLDYGMTNDLVNDQLINYTLNNPNAVFLKGWEFDYQTRFWYLPGILKGLVFNANYTRTSSKVKYPLTYIKSEFDWSVPGVVKSNIDTIYVDRLLDQPNKIINLSLGYDYKGFSGRLSMLYKDDVFMNTNFWPELREITDKYRRWDLSMKQKLPMNGLEIFLNVSNLTDAIDVNRFRGKNSSGNDLKSEQHYGKTIDVGFRYSF
jgi:TonB-dependent receptor